MSISSLTAKYRPQTFAEVVGQESVKTVLSRAAAKDQVAPAYLFSGTRGVGKTTIARIFAKALNCAEAPVAEPCNKCVLCKQASAGVAVDVVEIDAASHGGVDDARALKEDVGYAPLEGRYKVFIIDEAHMLSTAAFNALLKTLEEPPPRVTFILATTEAHKFPATIISRCQHYTFKMLLHSELVGHLKKIMEAEGLTYEQGAIDLVAKRGAGSVRDSMSLLGQCLALGGGTLAEADVRSFLGLAGQEVFISLMQTIHERDLTGVVRILRQVLDQGLDMGFFLRELTASWRNMFLLRQTGAKALEVLSLTEEEGRLWLEWAGRFHPSHIHACWQMTLDGQRRIMTSLEPALAMELLLLNLASLPDLLDLDNAGSRLGSAPAGSPSTGSGPSGATTPVASSGKSTPPASPPPRGQENMSSVADATHVKGPKAIVSPPVTPSAEVSVSQPEASSGDSVPEAINENPPMPEPPAMTEEPPMHGDNDASQMASDSEKSSGNNGLRNWEGFSTFMIGKNGDNKRRLPSLRHVKGVVESGSVTIICFDPYNHNRFSELHTEGTLSRLVIEYFGPGTKVRVELSERASKSPEQLREEAEQHPAVRQVMDAFGANIEAVHPRTDA